MNILFTCVGRRNYLLHYFRQALNPTDRIIAADTDSTAPALAVADKSIIVPNVYSEDYVEIILKLCVRENISALMSLNDLELPILAAARKRFQKIGVKLIISDKKVIETCSDKIETIRFSHKAKIATPKTYLSLDQAKNAIKNNVIKLPVVVKPRWGSASIGLEFPESIEEMELAYKFVSYKVIKGILYKPSMNHLDQAVLIQEKINGKEYGLDILNDLSGKTHQVYVKEKLSMRAGETDKAVLRKNIDLEAIGLKIGQTLGHIGNLDCDIFESDGSYYLLDMNPRFGGGYPFSHMAGARFPDALLAWIEGRSYDFKSFNWEYDQPFAKCDTLIKVRSE